MKMWRAALELRHETPQVWPLVFQLEFYSAEYIRAVRLTG